MRLTFTLTFTIDSEHTHSNITIPKKILGCKTSGTTAAYASFAKQKTIVAHHVWTGFRINSKRNIVETNTNKSTGSDQPSPATATTGNKQCMPSPLTSNFFSNSHSLSTILTRGGSHPFNNRLFTPNDSRHDYLLHPTLTFHVSSST